MSLPHLHLFPSVITLHLAKNQCCSLHRRRAIHASVTTLHLAKNQGQYSTCDTIYQTSIPEKSINPSYIQTERHSDKNNNLSKDLLCMYSHQHSLFMDMSLYIAHTFLTKGSNPPYKLTGIPVNNTIYQIGLLRTPTRDYLWIHALLKHPYLKNPSVDATTESHMHYPAWAPRNNTKHNSLDAQQIPNSLKTQTKQKQNFFPNPSGFLS